MKIFKYIEYAYLILACFFLFEAYSEWGAAGHRSFLYLFFVVAAIFMFFFKRKFRKRFDANNNPN